jgi:cAMP-dependent protein kinase regulator
MVEWLQSHRPPAISIAVQDQPKKQKEKKKNEEEENSESGESETNEEFLDIPSKKSTANKSRSSVSAEAYGLYHKKSAYTPKVVPKSQEQKDRIIKRLGQAFMFQALEDKEKEIVVNAMEEKKFK